MWNVRYDDAVRGWLIRDRPDDFHVHAIEDWVERLQKHGPPSDGVSTGDDEDLHAAKVYRTDITATYFVVVGERLIILKDIGG